MWVYRYGEISHSSAVSEGTIHAIQDCTSTGESLYFLSFREEMEYVVKLPKKVK